MKLKRPKRLLRWIGILLIAAGSEDEEIEYNTLGRVQKVALGPHPRPFFLREKGETGELSCNFPSP